MHVKLYIDSNEPPTVKKAVQKEFEKRDTSINTEVKGLKTGDFVYGDVAIERKEASDLASSIKSRRLKDQTKRILEDFQHGYLVVEGDPYNLRYSDLHSNAFVGSMVSRAEAGIRIIHTEDIKTTAYAVHKIAEKHSGKEREKRELKRTSVETEDPSVAMLTCINGISKEKAEKIVEEHGSDIQKISSLTPEELQTFKGIGKKLSKRIIDTLNGETEA